ncbi:MAG: DegV family protein, partial [Acutalibacteraceae bacterium]|nr:DegV family protein [Acutalibacteraceae bacterium]
HIPMSSSLSSSCDTAKGLAKNYNGKVFVADNKRISISQAQSVYDAQKMVQDGMSAEEIVKKLEADAYCNSIYLAVNTLELLKKSGRVTKAGAALATVLNLKPVLQIQGGKLDAFAKARGMANAKKTMLEAAKNDLADRFAGKKVKVEIAYSGALEPALEWQKEVQKFFGNKELKMYRLPLSICCHVGAGVAALGCIEYM